MKKILMGLLISMIFLSGCTKGDNSGGEVVDNDADQSVASTELLISAAASLTDCMNELAELYKEIAPDVKLTFSFGSSGSLQSQIEEGAPADVFISAAQKQMDTLEEKELIDPETRKNLLVNSVVLITPLGNPLNLSDFEEVVNADVKKIALGEIASVPVGQYSEEIFNYYGIMDQVNEKAVYGSDVRTVLTWVENGEVDCGVVYSTDAEVSDKVEIAAIASAYAHQPVIYPIAMVKNSENVDAAKAFIEFCSTDEAKEVFRKYGFAMAA